jgi:endonuclease IV
LIKTSLTWEKIACVHLNDSKCPFASCKDRHADLTTGLINKEGLKKFVQLCYKKGIPMVLETPCDSDEKCDTTTLRKKQINLVKEWCANC